MVTKARCLMPRSPTRPLYEVPGSLWGLHVAKECLLFAYGPTVEEHHPRGEPMRSQPHAKRSAHEQQRPERLALTG